MLKSSNICKNITNFKRTFLILFLLLRKINKNKGQLGTLYVF